MRKHRSSFLLSLLMVVLCGSIIIGSTLAYFTSEQTTGENIIAASTLKAGLDWAYQLPESESGWQNAANGVLFNEASWEPNYSAARYIRVKNGGSLAFSYELNVLPTMVVEGGHELMDVIDVYYGVVDADTPAITRSNFAQQLTRMGTMTELLSNEHGAGYGILLPEGVGVENLPAGVEGESGTVTACIVLHMQQGAGNEYMGLSAGEGFKLQLAAVQYNYDDAFANIPNPSLPDVNGYGTEVIKPLESVQGGVLTADMVFTSSNGVTATVPAGAKVEHGATQLKLIVTPKAQSDADVTLQAGEALDAWEVRVEGLAKDNTVPVRISLGAVMQKALNIGNYDLYHVENGATNKMARVDVVDADAPHNSYSYDPATGEVEVAMATFSEVTVIIDKVNAWKGVLDDSWYTDENATSYTIYNADQLAGFGKKVAEGTKFENKTVTLASDINLGAGTETYADGSKVIFYSIGTSVDYKQGTSPKAFAGTFDGAGHIITGLYQNGWEMGGNYDNGYFKNAMGLFGLVENGTVQNLTLDKFEMVMEFAPMGCVTAYVDGKCTFKNIAVFNSHPQTYNTAVAGIAGWDRGTSNLIFENITVDNSNMISALWGTYDCCAGGILGYLGEDSSAQLTNCHVAAQLDVYNDACANYQYYWYRYCGMLIGTVDGTVKDANGYTIPDISQITIEDCSVDYGNWNNYKYCEFETLGKGSYNGPGEWKFCRTDDSRCVAGHTHNVYESHEVLLPFKQLFGGYGWGVKGIESHEKVVVKSNMQSVEKFKVGIDELTVGKEYSLSDLFDVIPDKNVVDAAVQLGITVSEVNGAKYEYVQMDNPVNWRDNTLKFTELGDGKVHLTIQDYYYCIPTSVDIELIDKQPVEKFETKFTGDFLYRVGNQNEVQLDSLFKAKDGVEIGNVTVTIDTLEGTNASGTYTSNATWTNGTIQFSGTGVVKVTITDDDYCKPTELILEVINAKNITRATGTTEGGDMVLLCDVNTANYVNYWNCTLYGNGFTYSLKGAPTAYNSKQGHGVLITKNAILDNLVIVGDVYNAYGAYTTQDYYNAAIDAVGDTKIQNCYVANCSAPVMTRANVNIVDTTLYGGTVANLIIKSGTATLENVTTVNYDDGRELIGMGIVIHSDATDTAKLVLNGQLKQYNYICENKIPNDKFAKDLHTAMFKSDCNGYHFGTSPNRYVNTGIVSLTALFNKDDIVDNANTGYSGRSITFNDVNGYVYTQLNSTGTVDNSYNQTNDAHVSSVQGTVPPKYSFDYLTKNYKAKQDGSNDYCYEENGTVNISMDEGDTFNWDTSILAVSKAGINLDYTVSMNGIDYTDKSIAFNTAGNYTVVYSYTDPTNFYLNEDGNVATYKKNYTKTVNLTVAVAKATTKHAEFTFGSSNTASKTLTIGNSTYVMPNVTGTSSTIGMTIVSGNQVYYPIVEIVMSDDKTSHTGSWYAYFPVFRGAVTITDYKDNGTGDPVTFNSSTQSMPSGLSIVGEPEQLFKYQSSSTAGPEPVLKKNMLVYSSPPISAKRNEYNTVIEYSYTDNANATYHYYIGYHAPAQNYSSICVTPDTLVTLSDGSKKEIQHITYDDQLLVWDFFNGCYAYANPCTIVDHGTDINTVITLEFEDGTAVKAINEHAFMDTTANEFVCITGENVANYVGHHFAKSSDSTVTTVRLIGYSVVNESCGSMTIATNEHFNFFTEDMLSASMSMDNIGAFKAFEIGENLKYINVDEDIERYGLFTYDQFSDRISEAAFDGINVRFMKIAIGKGLISEEAFQRIIDDMAVYIH